MKISCPCLQVDKYTWVDVGSSYLPSDILAAFLYGQLEQRDKIQAHRQSVWQTYHSGLQAWAERNGVQQPFIPNHVDQAYHMYYLLLPDLEMRQDFIQTLRQQGIYTVFHYLPLHLSDMGLNFGGKPGDCPVTESASDRLVRLPFYNDMSTEDQARVIETIKQFKF